MKTFYDLVQDYLVLSHDDSSGNETLGRKLLNYYLNKILSAQKWTFNRDKKNITTVADLAAYPLPYNCAKVLGVKVLTGGVYYSPREIVNRNTWNKINYSSAGKSDIPSFFYIDPIDNKVELYPIPSSAGNTITVYYTKRVQDLSQYDLTSTIISYIGTVSIDEDAISVVGTNTNFTSSMVDKWLKLTEDSTWYKISAVADTTHLTLSAYFSSAYFGGTAASNAYFTIGERVPLPEGYEDIILWGALSNYFRQRGENLKMAQEYDRMFKEGFTDLIRRDQTSETSFLQSDADVNNYFGVNDINDYPSNLT